MTTREVLLEAAALVKKGWTQKAYARNERGNSVFADSYSATCWCLMGAIDRAAQFQVVLTKEAYEMIDSVFGRKTDFAAWNDDSDRTQAEVVALLRKAAEAAA